MLLGKLSNFRAVSLAVGRELVAPDLDERLGVALRLESQRREMDRSVLIETTGTWIQVNKFQQQFWTNASRASWLSASAPTASGKTFLVLQWLIDQLGAAEATVAVYLAPNRRLRARREVEIGRESAAAEDHLS